MHKEFEIIGNKVVVKDEYYNESTRPYSDNIKEILTAENNIEKINSLLNKEKNYINTNKIKLFSGIAQLSLSGVQALNGFFNLSQGYDCGKIILGLGTCFLFSGCIFTISSNKNLKFTNQKSKILEDALINQQEKLNELNNNKSNDNIINTHIKKINTSEEIIDLKANLWALDKFKYNKKEYIKYYKKGILKEKLQNNFYSKKEIYHIENIVKDNVENKKILRKDVLCIKNLK